MVYRKNVYFMREKFNVNLKFNKIIQNVSNYIKNFFCGIAYFSLQIYEIFLRMYMYTIIRYEYKI